MHNKITYICLLLCLLWSHNSLADIMVITNKNCSLEYMQREQIVDLYMGRTIYLPDQSLAIRIDLPPDSPIRKNFYRKLVNKSVTQVNAYWARLLFTGRSTPPQVLDSPEHVINAIRQNKNAIGYINEADLDDSVKVVGKL